MTHTSSAKVTGTTNAQILETAHLSADSIRVQDVELQEIIDNVETDGLTPAKLVQRETIGENDYYILTDDTGQPVEIHFPPNVFPSWANNSGLKYVNWDTDEITSGDSMFYKCSNLQKVHSNFKKLVNGSHMFAECENLQDINLKNSKLTQCAGMFSRCKKLTTVDMNLTLITNGNATFSGCSKLTSLNLVSLEGLTQGSNMFNDCSLLGVFGYNLNNLVDGNNMFFGCASLENFSSDISSLETAHQMFALCYKLRTFSSKLPSLTNGAWMFALCKLDKASVMNIITSLKEDNICDSGNPQILLGIDKTLATDSELLTFLGISSGISQTINITNPKGIDWQVILQWN